MEPATQLPSPFTQQHLCVCVCARLCAFVHLLPHSLLLMSAVQAAAFGAWDTFPLLSSFMPFIVLCYVVKSWHCKTAMHVAYGCVASCQKFQAMCILNSSCLSCGVACCAVTNIVLVGRRTAAAAQRKSSGWVGAAQKRSVHACGSQRQAYKLTALQQPAQHRMDACMPHLSRHDQACLSDTALRHTLFDRLTLPGWWQFGRWHVLTCAHDSNGDVSQASSMCFLFVPRQRVN